MSTRVNHFRCSWSSSIMKTTKISWSVGSDPRVVPPSTSDFLRFSQVFSCFIFWELITWIECHETPQRSESESRPAAEDHGSQLTAHLCESSPRGTEHAIGWFKSADQTLHTWTDKKMTFCNTYSTSLILTEPRRCAAAVLSSGFTSRCSNMLFSVL